MLSTSIIKFSSMVFTFSIPGEIVKKYKISSWELNDGKDDPKCHEYNLNFGHGAPHHQYIHLKPSRCGSILECTRNSYISCEVSWLLALVITTLMFIFMFTFVMFSDQLTLPFPS